MESLWIVKPHRYFVKGEYAFYTEPWQGLYLLIGQAQCRSAESGRLLFWLYSIVFLLWKLAVVKNRSAHFCPVRRYSIERTQCVAETNKSARHLFAGCPWEKVQRGIVNHWSIDCQHGRWTTVPSDILLFFRRFDRMKNDEVEASAARRMIEWVKRVTLVIGEPQTARTPIESAQNTRWTDQGLININVLIAN